MEVGLPHVAVWIIVGILAGAVTRHDRQGGLPGIWCSPQFRPRHDGALVGGILFRVFRLFPNLDKFCVSMRDLIGSALVPLIL